MVAINHLPYNMPHNVNKALFTIYYLRGLDRVLLKCFLIFFSELINKYIKWSITATIAIIVICRALKLQGIKYVLTSKYYTPELSSHSK